MTQYAKKDICVWPNDTNEVVKGLFPKGGVLTVEHKGKTGQVTFVPMDGHTGLKPTKDNEAGYLLWKGIPYSKIDAEGAICRISR